MLLNTLHILLLHYVVAAETGGSAPAGKHWHCPASTVAGETECPSDESFRSDPVLAQTVALKEMSERGPQGHQVSTTVDQRLDKRDAVEVAFPMTSPSDTQAPYRMTYSSQQATEVLVGRWNDLSSWTENHHTPSVCRLDVERTISGFITNEMWALRMFDAWAKPGPSVLDGRSQFAGNYYQCRDTRAPPQDNRSGFRGNYCVVTLSNLTHPVNSSAYRVLGLSRVQLGTCLPDTCTEADVTGLFQERLQHLNLTTIFLPLSTDCRNDDRESTTFTVLAIFIVLVIGTLVFFGTVIDLLQVYCPGRGNSKKVETKQMKGVWIDVLVSFSIYRNGKRLMMTSDAPGSVDVIPGIRFLSMSWVLIGHSTTLIVMYYASNAVQGVEMMASDRLNDIISSKHFGVDSFFVISGFLVSYLKIKDVIDKGWNFSWGRYFVHRYWRLTPSLIIVIILIQGLQRFVVSGTMAPTVQPIDKMQCEKYWWLLPLYINNYFKTDVQNMCMAHTWSLAADMQFYAVSPFMLIPFYYHRYAGVASCLLFIAGQWILVGYLSYENNGGFGIISWSSDWYKNCYYPSYARIAPFALGILSGYLLSVNNGRVQMSKSTVVAGWVLVTAAAFTVTLGINGSLDEESPSSLLMASIFNAFSRSIWGACVCWVIVACASGYGGPVTSFLTWPPFTVLGRLTFFAYLIQMSISTVLFENLDQHVHLNTTSTVIFGTVGLVLTCVVAAVLVVCVEFPTLNLEKVFRDKNTH